MEYLMLSVAALLLGVNFTLNKIYQNHNGTGIRSVLFFNTCFGLVNAVMFFLLNGCTLHLTWYSVLMATIRSLLIMSYTAIGFVLLRRGDAGDIYAVSDERRDDPPVSLGASFPW